MSIALLPGNPAAFVVHLIDITERRDTEARLAHQALHDPLTGLPNRALLFDRLAQAVRAALRGGPGVTVLYLDVDNFKTINDTRGHTVGDRVLRVVADRLARVLRPADTVARLGGDEFAIVAEGLPTDAAQELADRVADAINEPVPLTRARARCRSAPASASRTAPRSRWTWTPCSTPPTRRCTGPSSGNRDFRAPS